MHPLEVEKVTRKFQFPPYWWQSGSVPSGGPSVKGSQPSILPNLGSFAKNQNLRTCRCPERELKREGEQQTDTCYIMLENHD